MLERGYGEKGALLDFWWECKLIQPLWRAVWRFLKKIGIKLPYEPTIPLLGIYPEETIIEKSTCTPVFIAALFVVVRTWKGSRCLSTDEWIQKSWYIYTMEYYSTIKKNTFESALKRWRNLEPIIQREVIQKEKDKHCILTHIYGIQKDDTDEPIFRAAVEIQTQRTDFWTQLGKERVGQMERVVWKHICPCL